MTGRMHFNQLALLYTVTKIPYDSVFFNVCVRRNACILAYSLYPLQPHHNKRDGFSNHQLHECLLKRLFRHRWKKKPQSSMSLAGEFPTQRASNAENVSIWRHHSQSGIFLYGHFHFCTTLSVSLELLYDIKQPVFLPPLVCDFAIDTGLHSRMFGWTSFTTSLP